MISFSILVLLGLGIYITSLEYSKINDKSSLSLQINNAVFQLNSLTSDYLLYHQDRAYNQWIRKHASMQHILTPVNFRDAKSIKTFQSLQQLHKKSLGLFERTVAAHQSSLKNAVQTQVAISQEKSLAAQLLTTTQVMASYATRLSNMTQAELENINKTIFWLAVSMLIVFILLLTGIWSFIAYRVVIPIHSLQKQITNFSSNNLDLRLTPKHADEIGDVAQSFNDMASELQNTLVSKHKLLREIEDRKKAEEALKRSSEEWSYAMDFFQDAICLLDMDYKVIRANKTFYEYSRLTPEQVTDKDISSIFPPYDAYLADSLYREEKELIDKTIIMEVDDPNNPIDKPIEIGVRIIKNKDNTPLGILLGIRDLTKTRTEETEKERLQRELSQSQKMDALGQLTGGIAHDFNNMLGIILGYTTLALERYQNDIDSKLCSYLENIEHASTRAKDLISQMLLFSRSEIGKSRPMNIDSLVKNDIKMLRSIIPSSIQINYHSEENLPKTMMDPVKLQQILMNLSINAKDAMDGTGMLTISLKRNKNTNEECATCHKRIKGDWLELSVADTGCGISDDMLPHIFEPFFTTKGTGEGTGMGMSMVHGIIKGYDGHIIVETKPGKGSHFRLLLPPAPTNLIEETNNKDPNSGIHLQGNGQKILIVDDQPALANYLSELLQNNGYHCTIETKSPDAFELFATNPDEFDLLITDQTMPDLTGMELIKKIQIIQPQFPVILTTGYSDKINKEQAEKHGVYFLRKPANSEIILRKIAEALDT